ncbi:UNVERIFIED_CONTAM: glucosamine-6-phosphate deaminase [Brevibacillus sp. OAP136]
MIRVIVTEDYQELSYKAAQLLSAQLQKKPESVIGFATGSTPIGMYKELIQSYNRKEVDFGQMSTFNLDEYVGLTREHPQSYYHFMQEQLFSHINVRPEKISFPPGIFSDAGQACQSYEDAMKAAGGVDLQILGIGVNGHIGFNEPDRHFTLYTHIVELAQKTIESNARFFGSEDEVPRSAITMGIKSIMDARSILLLASDRNKAEAVRQIFSGKVDPQVPATVLQLHPDVTLVVDREAASLLNKEFQTGGVSVW